MNEDTLIVVSCYAGDRERVVNNLPCYLHHGASVIIMSPEDSQVELPGIICRYAGKRAYIGQESLDRQRLHLYLALEYNFQYFLFNDSDSLCVSPEIPRYLYEESENTIWSNECREPRPHASPYPKIALHPPYFLRRDTLVKMLSVADSVGAHPITPYIDHWMLELACVAGVQHRAFWSKETTGLPIREASEPAAMQSIRIRDNGRVMLHPVKTLEDLNLWRAEYEQRR